MSKPQALCLHKHTVDRILYASNIATNARGFIPMDADQRWRFKNNLDASLNDAWFIPRFVCETDPDFLQLLPYVIVQMPNQKMLGYNRPAKGGGEQRLAGNFSIGIGGHVELIDFRRWSGSALEVFGLQTVLADAARREILEEIKLTNTQSVTSTTLHLAGLIRSDDSPVDSVHLGLVFILQLEAASPDATCSAASAEPDQIINLRELKLVEARAEANPESWTAKVLASDLLDSWGK